ncbi:MAG: DMT family transporter [Cyanophyceae cyanobacterium]
MNLLRQLPWLLVALSTCCSCLGTLLVKQSRLVNHASVWEAIASPWFVAALLVYSTGLLMFTQAIARLPVSAVVPFSTGLGFILTTLLSHWLLGERLTMNQLAACSLILAGIIVMTR